MFTALNQLLDIDDCHLPKERFYLISESQNDGSFIIHHFLSFYLKAGYNVIFIGLVQSLTHYMNVAQKLAVNLSLFEKNGKLVFVEGLKLAIKNLEVNTSDISSHMEGNPLTYLTSREPKFSLKPLYELIRNKIETVKNNEPFVVIIDDVSLFLSLGVSTIDIQDFVHYCQIAVCSSGKQGCLLILVHADHNNGDSDEELLERMLIYKCDVQLHVMALSSGYCREVHGELAIIHHDVALTKACTTEKIVQFKITDKNVSFFAPGNSSAVL